MTARVIVDRVWDIRESDPEAVESLAQSLDLPSIIAQLLIHRDIDTPEKAERFLTPSLSELDDPGSMKGMQLAVERLVQAIRSGERVCIYGDYDVDGITSVSLLLLFLRQIGLDADYYIPSRLVEGYGLNSGSIEEIASKGTRLLITVDCGISDVDQIRLAYKSGMDVIVIDHHQVPDELPPAVAILNPHQPDCPFPTKELAAVGVTFNLVMALRAVLRRTGLFDEKDEPNLREFLDLVSLGTVADIVPLMDENRIITHFGLAELSAGRRPGVAALKEVAGMLSQKVAVGQVAFRLAPRINAVGRLGRASQAVELLTTRSYSSALKLARDLDRANSERQAIEQEIFDQAAKQAQAMTERDNVPALVLASKDWHVGVVGIVASRLVERFARPVVLIALNGDQGRGSARGTENVHLYRAMLQCADTLLAFGGHQAAAGLTLESDKVDDFRKEFLETIHEQTSGVMAPRRLKIDGLLQPGELSADLIKKLEMMAPHGMGNPEPLFMAKAVELRSARMVGRDAPYHLKAMAVDGNQTLSAIGFGMGDRLKGIGERMDLAYTPEFNTWDGQTNIQLRLRDIRPST